MYDFHIFITLSSSFHGFITNHFNDLLPVGWIFFTLSFRNCKSCVCNCDDHPSFNSSLSSSHVWFSYIHNFIIILSRVYNESLQRPAPSWLVSLHQSRPISQRSRVRIPYKPEFFSGFLFATAKVAYLTAMIILHVILHSTFHIYDFHIFINSINY